LQFWFLKKFLVVVFEFWDGLSWWFWQESIFWDERPIFGLLYVNVLVSSGFCVFCLLLPLF
jgi:hypothetical protein